jgi:ATP-dependent RNA helicase RhlE
MPFSQLGLSPSILQAIQDAGYTEPTPIQAAAIPLIIAGGDLIGIAQTGTGKTAAFTLPVLTRLAANPPPAGQRRSTRVLILAPTRELVVQIEENVRAYAKHQSPRIAKIFGGVGENPQKEALRSGAEIVIACPGRLLDLINQGHSDFSKVDHLILDEADRMLDMGFLPDIRRIINRLPKKRQTLMFSATLSKEIESLTHEFQHSPKIVQIGKRSNPAETVTQMVYEVPRHLKLGPPFPSVGRRKDANGAGVYPHQTWRRQNRPQTGIGWRPLRDAARQPVSKPATEGLSRFQILRCPRPGRHRHRRTRH